MQFSRAFLALVVAGLASAQLPNVPSCSLNCFVSALSRDGCSQLTDFACHCQKPQLISDITPCVQSDCNKADQSSVSNVIVSQCSQAGHPITLPPVEAATTASTVSETSSTTTNTELSNTGTTTATKTTPSSSSSASSSCGSSSSSSTSSSSTSSSLATSPSSSSVASSSQPAPSLASPTHSGNSTYNATASPTAPHSNNVGANRGNMVGIAIAAAAAAAVYML